MNRVDRKTGLRVRLIATLHRSWLGAATCMLVAWGAAAPGVQAEGVGAAPALARDDAFATGCALLAEGRTAEALPWLQQAARRDPERAECVVKLADALEAVGRADEAERVLESKLPGLAEPMPAVLKLAGIRSTRGQWKDVARLLTAHKEELPENGVLLLSSALSETGDRGAAAMLLRRALERLPDSEPLWLALVDQSLRSGRHAAALRDVRRARDRIGETGALCYRAAQAYFALRQYLGEARCRKLERAQPGQFVNGELIVEAQGDSGLLLCCPPQSALYQIRKAIDAGFEAPAAFVLHARIWSKLERPRTGLAILQGREAVLLSQQPAPPEVLQTFRDLALEAGELAAYLRYSRRLAEESPEAARKPTLRSAYLEVAARYNARGDEATYLEFLHRALDLDPQDIDLALQVADADWSAQRRDDAVVLYRRILAAQPQHGERQRILERLAGQ